MSDVPFDILKVFEDIPADVSTPFTPASTSSHVASSSATATGAALPVPPSASSLGSPFVDTAPLTPEQERQVRAIVLSQRTQIRVLQQARALPSPIERTSLPPPSEAGSPLQEDLLQRNALNSSHIRNLSGGTISTPATTPLSTAPTPLTPRLNSDTRRLTPCYAPPLDMLNSRYSDQTAEAEEELQAANMLAEARQSGTPGAIPPPPGAPPVGADASAPNGDPLPPPPFALPNGNTSEAGAAPPTGAPLPPKKRAKHSLNASADAAGSGGARGSGGTPARQGNGSSSSTPGTKAPKPPRPPKVRKVVVTSCDACRSRKLRCNAKELPLGEACSNCVRSKQQCSFDYCADTTGGTIRLRNRVAEIDGMSSAAAIAAAGSLTQLAETSVVHRQPALEDGISASGTGASGGITSRSGWSSYGGWADMPNGLRRATDEPESWDVPQHITSTDPNTNITSTNRYPVEGVINTLFARFFETGHLHSTVIFQNDVMSRYTAQKLARAHVQAGGDPSSAAAMTSHPDGPVPTYLILAIISSAAVAHNTSEPELKEWGKNVGWHLALKALHQRLATDGVADLDLIQGIILIASNWCGDHPNSQERIALFETAFRLAYDVNLTTSLDLDSCPREVRAKRVVTFWTLYALDKTLALICRRPSQLNSDQHSMPKLTLGDVVLARAKGDDGLLSKILSTSADDPGRAAQNEDVWSCRLLESFITLAKTLESTTLPMIERRAMQSLTFRAMQNQITSVEGQLEEWCQNHGELLSTATGEGIVYQGIAEALVALLHVSQLQLYSPALRYEARQAQKHPIKFCDANGKALTACIESSWHLIQQPESRFSLAGPTGDLMEGGIIASSITSLGVVRATQFLRFLSNTWADWRDGYGMHDRLPGSIGPAPDQAQPAEDPALTMPPAVQPTPGPSVQNPRQAAYETAVPETTTNGAAVGASSSKQWGMMPPPPPAAAASGRGKRGRKQAPAPLDFASPSTSTDAGSTAAGPSGSDSAAAGAEAGPSDTSKAGGLAAHERMQPTPTTPARFLFEIPKTAGLSGWTSIGSMPGAMGAMMTPLRPDFLGGLDLNIEF